MKLMEGALNWFEIPVNDIDRAQRFYEGIFSIQMRQTVVGKGLKVAVFPVTPDGVGGALCEHKGFYTPSHDGTLVYLNGDPDLQEVLDKVEDYGGRVVILKNHISPQFGYMAVFEDPEGNRVALRSMQ